jgi:hypothetical protein
MVTVFFRGISYALVGPSSYVRVATPFSEMSWTSYGPFHDFSILDPLLDHFLVLKSKTLSPFFILSDFESTFLFFVTVFFRGISYALVGDQEQFEETGT